MQDRFGGATAVGPRAARRGAWVGDARDLRATAADVGPVSCRRAWGGAWDWGGGDIYIHIYIAVYKYDHIL